MERERPEMFLLATLCEVAAAAIALLGLEE
jgi:hypothetical protein